MSSILRSALAVLVGLAVTFALVWLSDMSIRGTYTLPGPEAMRDPETARAALAAVPFMALWLVVMGWGLAGGVGAFVAARLARHMRVGLVVVAVLALATVVNLAMFPHPLWMWPTSLLLIVGLGWVGARAGAR